MQNGYGFETDGSTGQYVDLGNWTGETCFVDVDECTEGDQSNSLNSEV